MHAADIMTRELITVSPLTTLKEAVTLLLQHGVSGLPVLSGAALVGIVTEGDLMRRGELATERYRSRLSQLFGSATRQALEYVHTHGQHVAELMTPDPVSVGPDTALSDIVTVMEARHIKRLPVLSEGRLVGIVSRADLLRALIGLLPGEFQFRADQQIECEIRQQIERLPWAPRAAVGIAVRDGVVELTGTVIHVTERAGLRVLAANVAGVRKVIDNLLWIDPIGGTVIDLAPVVEEPATAWPRHNTST
jgi:CBS domain-containing protein